MENRPDIQETLRLINEKHQAESQDPGSYLKGMLYSKPLTYWDYVELDTLLSLQRPKTNYPDEPIFVMYHQVTELMLKLIIHELKQVVDGETPPADFFRIKIERVNRYAGILTQSFGVMREGMDYDQYNEFRLALAPASGFQSAQFRMVELMCTDVHLLLNHRVKGKMDEEQDMNVLFEHLYWKDAGLDRKTGKKSQMLRLFEERYLESLLKLADTMRGKNLLHRFNALDPASAGYAELKNALRDFDHTYNVKWPLEHLRTAQHYLNAKGEMKAATGGSEWQKYLHPSYQRRIFFPGLWTAAELENWGNF
jgi:tryptophan 2,3-dioxygenase